MSRTRALVIAGSAILVLLLAVPAVAPHALNSWMRPDTSPATVGRSESLSWSVTVGDASNGLWQSFPVTLTWSDSAPQIDEGFTLDLPAELTPLADDFDVRTATGETVARAVVDDRSLALRYTDGARDTVTGTATFLAAWDDAAVNAGEEHTLQFSASGTIASIPVSIESDRHDPGESRLYGYWRDRAHEDRMVAASAVQWRFVTPVGPLRDAVLDVQAAEGHRVECAEIAGRLQTAFAANGDVTDAHDLPSEALDVRACDASGFTVDLGRIDAGSALMVRYSSTVTDPVAPSYTSSARVTLDDRSHDLTSTIERTVAAGIGHGTVNHELVAALGPRSMRSAGGALGWVPLALLTLLGGAGLLYRVTRSAR